MKIDKMDLLETYIRIAKMRSISKAADDLEVAPATVSRKLTRLEKMIGQTLVRRSTLDLSLTETGERFLLEAQDLLHRWLLLEDRYKNTKHAMSGPLKIIVPVGIGQAFLTDIAIDFRKSYPSIELSWIFHSESEKFPETGCDLWLCLGERDIKDLIIKKLAIMQFSLVAAPEFIANNTIRGPASVEKLTCVALNTKDAGTVELVSECSHSSRTINLAVVFSSNDIYAVHTAILKGIGFGILPDWFVKQDLESGKLIKILPEWAAPTVALYAVADTSHYKNQRVEAFMKYLSSRLIEVPGLRIISDQPVISIY